MFFVVSDYTSDVLNLSRSSIGIDLIVTEKYAFTKGKTKTEKKKMLSFSQRGQMNSCKINVLLR